MSLLAIRMWACPLGLLSKEEGVFLLDMGAVSVKSGRTVVVNQFHATLPRMAGSRKLRLSIRLQQVEDRGLEPLTFWLPARQHEDASVARDGVTETDSPVCTSVCTRLSDSVQVSLETLAADLRRRLSVDDCRRLAVMLTGSGDETDCGN